MTSTHDVDALAGRPPIDDALAEKLLTGRAVPADLEPLAGVLRALREQSRQPVRPSAELAAYLATDGRRQPGRRVPGRPASGRRVAGRIRVGTRLAVAGAAAAVVGVGSVGFAGSLPDPVQDGFETVVESVTPYQFPKRSGGPDAPTDPAGPVDPTRPVDPADPARPVDPDQVGSGDQGDQGDQGGPGGRGGPREPGGTEPDRRPELDDRPGPGDRPEPGERSGPEPGSAGRAGEPQPAAEPPADGGSGAAAPGRQHRPDQP